VNRILATARPVGESIPDALYGYGLVDAYAAVTAQVPLVDAHPLGTLDEWVTLHRRLEGSSIVVPLGPTNVAEEAPKTADRVIAAAPDTRRDTLPYVVTGIFAVLLLLVLASGTGLAWLRRGKR
jgi:hypothetical protein